VSVGLLLPISLARTSFPLMHTRTVNCGRMPPRSVLARTPTPAVLVISLARCCGRVIDEGGEGGREGRLVLRCDLDVASCVSARCT